MNNKVKDFLNKIEYNFNNESLLEEALTHPSSAGNNSNKNYQRLEFLGDTILSMIIAEILFQTYAKEKEGSLSKRQAYLVSGTTIAKIAQEIKLGEIMIFSKNEENNNGRENKRNLENGLEALIGAIYLDSNLENCQKFVKKYWHELIKEELTSNLDPVSHLQEIVQAKTKKLPKYQTTRSGGNEHEPIFTSVVEIDGNRYAANGSSKKEAQKKAAIHAIELLTN